MTKYASLLLLFLLVFTTWGCQPQIEATDGAPGIGDSYYPGLGNGGYDVENYIIALDVDPATNVINGTVTIQAIAKETLASFNLDFHGLIVDKVTVNKKDATFSRTDDELVITPKKGLKLNKPFTVLVEYHGSPKLIKSIPIGTEMGWSHADDGTINVFGEPDAASTWFPNNNHPRDKATYRFEITVPKPWIVAATGILKRTKENGDRTTYIWEMIQPMATYLASINIDHYELRTQSSPNGVKIRNYIPSDYPVSLQTNLDVIPEAIDYFSSLFGPYPFDEYGVVIADETGVCEVDLALEAQSMSIHCPSMVMMSEEVIVHELAHQWFGDNVSLKNWKDVWLKEGMSRYAEWLWLTRDKDPAILNKIVKIQMNTYFPLTLTGAPPKDDLYRNEVYKGGALVYHALRLQVGDDAFFKIIRTYLDRYGGGYAGTDEFIAIAEEISGQDLQEFFDTWLFSSRLPKMPEVE